MAWRRPNFRRSYQKVRQYGVRSSARYAYKKGGGSLIFGLGGVAAGYLAPRVVPYQDVAITAIAVLPGVLPMGRTVPWQIRRAASGYVLGSMLRNVLPNVMGVNASSGGVQFA